MSNGWKRWHYDVFRFVLGAYLAFHFGHLVPWGPEVFSSAGMLPDASASPFYGVFPNVLFVWEDPLAVRLFLVLGVVLSLAFAAGVRDRPAAIALWYVWACLFTRNPLISNPGLPFIGWLLIAHCFVPRRAPDGSSSDWKMPRGVYAAAWIVMALGYTYSGATKLVSPSWLDGTALAHVLSNPLARPTLLRETLVALPSAFVALGTWGALAAELGFAPLALFRSLRPAVWGGMLLMHFSLMILIDFVDLSAGMVMLHLFTFDPAWVSRYASSAASSGPSP